MAAVATPLEVGKRWGSLCQLIPPRIAGAEVENAAKEKFQKVQDAYETIKKKRGIN